MDEIYGIEEFKANFRKVIDEIDLIVRGSFKEQEALEKLKKLFSEEQLRRIEEFMELMRKKTKESEERALATLQEAEHYKNELEKEKNRLEKLWDAYKRQEDEFMHHGSKTNELEEQLAQKNDEIKELKQQINEMEDLKEKYETVELLRNELEDKTNEIKDINIQLVKQKEKIKSLELEVEDLKLYIPYKKQSEELAAKVKEMEPLRDLVKVKEQYEEIEERYRKEQERLAKLFKKYEETTHDYEEAREKLDHWESWYASNKTFIESAATAFSKFKMPD